jgi:hypothetical protein
MGRDIVFAMVGLIPLCQARKHQTIVREKVSQAHKHSYSAS